MKNSYTAAATPKKLQHNLGKKLLNLSKVHLSIGNHLYFGGGTNRAAALVQPFAHSRLRVDLDKRPLYDVKYGKSLNIFQDKILYYSHKAFD